MKGFFDEFIDVNETEIYLENLKKNQKTLVNEFNLNLKNSGLYYKGEIYPVCMNPIILQKNIEGTLQNIASNFSNLMQDFVFILKDNESLRKRIVTENPTYSVLEKAILELNKSDFQNLFYRLDGIIENNELKIIEANMNSPGGTLTIDKVHKMGNEIFSNHFSQKPLEFSRISDKLKDNFLNYYKTNFSNDELFLVVGNKEDAEISEHNLWSEFLRNEGINSKTVDYRDQNFIQFQNNLNYKTEKVGIIYRRVFPLDENPLLLNSELERKIFVLNPSASYVLGSKSIFALFHELKNNELKHHREFIENKIPYTGFLRNFNNFEITTNKDHYVLKEIGNSGGHGIYVGKGESKESWEKILKNISENSVVQEYYKQPRMNFIDNKFRNSIERKFDFNIYCIGNQAIAPYIRVNHPKSFKSNSACGASEGLCYVGAQK